MSGDVVAHYAFNGDFNDSVNGYNLTASGGTPPSFQTGNCSGTGTLEVVGNSANNYMIAPAGLDTALSNQTAFTVDGWFNTGSGTVGWPNLFYIGGSLGVTLSYYQGTGQLHLNGAQVDGLSPNTCYHVVMSYNAGTIYIYVNGTEVWMQGGFAPSTGAVAAVNMVQSMYNGVGNGNPPTMDDWTISTGPQSLCPWMTATSTYSPSATPTPTPTQTSGGLGPIASAKDMSASRLRLKLGDGRSLVLAPNPASAQVVAYYFLEENQVAELEITNILGETVLSENLGSGQKGSGLRTLDLSRLASGVYIALLEEDNGGGMAKKAAFKFAIVK